MERDPWREYSEYEHDKPWRDRDRRQGHKRYEILVPVSALVRWVKRIFGGKKK
jgi:hypothetical protein